MQWVFMAYVILGHSLSYSNRYNDGALKASCKYRLGITAKRPTKWLWERKEKRNKERTKDRESKKEKRQTSRYRMNGMRMVVRRQMGTLGVGNKTTFIPESVDKRNWKVKMTGRKWEHKKEQRLWRPQVQVMSRDRIKTITNISLIFCCWNHSPKSKYCYITNSNTTHIIRQLLLLYLPLPQNEHYHHWSDL